MDKRKVFVFLRYLITLLLTAFVAVTIVHMSTKEREEKPITSVPVVVAQPQRGTLEQGLTVSGHIQTDHLVAVIPLASGKLVSWNINVGDVLLKDQVLATIDPEPYRQQLLQAQSAKDVAQTTFERIRSLHAAKVITDQIFEEAQAQRDATQAQWELAQRQLAHTTIQAPIRGTVIQSLGSVGNMASPDKPVAILADMDNLTVTVHIPQSNYDVITKNRETLSLRVSRTLSDGSVRKAIAKTESISPMVDPSSNTFSMVCKLIEGTEHFIPGMHVSLTIVYETLHDGFILNQADRTVDGGFYVYDEDQKMAHFQKIPIIAENDSLVAIDAAYKSTYFIVDGHHTILDGQPVAATSYR